MIRKYPPAPLKEARLTVPVPQQIDSSTGPDHTSNTVVSIGQAQELSGSSTARSHRERSNGNKHALLAMTSCLASTVSPPERCCVVRCGLTSLTLDFTCCLRRSF